MPQFPRRFMTMKEAGELHSFSLHHFTPCVVRGWWGEGGCDIMSRLWSNKVERTLSLTTVLFVNIHIHTKLRARANSIQRLHTEIECLGRSSLLLGEFTKYSYISNIREDFPYFAKRKTAMLVIYINIIQIHSPRSERKRQWINQIVICGKRWVGEWDY